jgi:outer membrane receptor for Fe3+-dicitrate
MLEALAYSRHAQRRTVNGDEAEEATPEANAAFNNTFTRQRGSGMAVALSGRTAAHRWQWGFTADQARVHFEQTEQEGNFTASRGVVALAGEDPELSVSVAGESRTLGLYGSTTWQLSPATHLTGTLRWNQAVVSNTLTRVDDDTDELVTRPREQFRYRSLNPALGLAHRLGSSTQGLTVFANIARNTRVPTVIELGCADPDEPCRLPVGLQADPYLKQVRSISLETGLRWGRLDGSGGGLTLYRADNRDDILFRSVSVTGQRGYFVNVERTRHQGLDAEWRWVGQTLSLAATYSHLLATYEAEGLLRVGERNVAVKPGTAIAGMPKHMAKLSADWRLNPAWSVGADAQLLSRRTTAGNEDGGFENDEDETADFSLPGYGVLNLRASWRPAGVRGLEIGLKINNVLDRRYHSYGALAETLFTPQGAYSGDERNALFAAPGAPRALSVTVRWVF